MTFRSLCLTFVVAPLLPAVAAGLDGGFTADRVDSPELAMAAIGERVDLTAPGPVVRIQRERWRNRFQRARDAVARARQRRSRAQDAYAEMRHRRRKRGERKAATLTELSSSERALQEAEAALADLLETARKAGVPPGWMSTTEPAAPAIPSPAKP